MNNQIQLVLKSSTDEISLNDHELGIYLIPDLDGLVGLPEIRTTSGVNAGYDGGWTSAQNYDARSITIKGVIANTDVATVESLRKKLVSLAGQGKSEELTLDLVTEAGNAYTLQVRTIALDMAMQSVLNKQEFMLQLRADDPLIYDASETTHEALIQVAKATGGFQINFELPLAITGSSEETVVENNGLERVPTITRLYGALHNPKIINRTTNQSMQIETDLGFSEGQWITPSDTLQGKIIEIENAPAEAPLASLQLDGNTSQNGTPTPSAPVAVQTVTGENVVRITGKNLYDGEISATNQRLSTSTGGGYSLQGWDISSYVSVQPNTTYTINTQDRIFCDEYAIDKTFIRGTAQIYGSTDPITITTTSTTRFIRFDFPTGNASVSMLELGSTATDYEPYQGQSYEVNLGKNLAPNVGSYTYQTNSGSDITSQTSSAIVFTTGTSTNSGIYIYKTAGDNATLCPYLFESGYVVSFTAKASANCALKYGLSGAQITSNITTSETRLSVATAAGAGMVFYNMSGNSATITISDIQVESGSQATSYAAFFEPIELCKIGDYQDYIYKSGGKWYVRKECGKAILNGSEAWVDSSTYGYVCMRGHLASFTGAGKPLLYCDQFTRRTSSHGEYEYIWIQDTSGNLYLQISDSRLSAHTLDAFKEWLATNQPSVYYVLATPTDTEITNEALVAQLETLLNTARTYAGINNIFTITPNEQGTMEIRYYTEKTQDYRDVVEIDSRLRTITLNGLDIYHLQTDGSDFLMLAPGENRLSLQSDITGDNGYAEVSYKQGYLSI